MSLSLSRRLYLYAGIVLCLFLALTAYVLNQAFVISLDNLVREKLQSHIYTLISLADYRNGAIRLPQKLSEQRFNHIDSALMAFVSDSDNQESWRSISADNKQFSLPAPDDGEWLFGRAQDSSGEAFHVISYNTIWPDSRGGKKSFVFTVMERVDYYDQQRLKFYYAVISALFVIGLILLVLQAVIFQLGLKPVRKLAQDVDAMNNHKITSLTGNYPKELQPLTQNLNLLINNERRLRQRYKDRMADLSHSLKTPLAVLNGIEHDVDDDGEPITREQLLDKIKMQVSRMNSSVEYQLQRAVLSKQPIRFVKIPIASEVNNLIAALDKVYLEKKVTASITVDDKLCFYGDENDLIELLGNLLDNAYKHCRHRVGASAVLNDNDAAPMLVIHVEDDGDGIPANRRAEILQRGVRLDTQLSGQGLGLAIIKDIVTSYNGSLQIEDSVMGGARFTVTLPAH